jgi:hypothetical protein
MDGEKSGDSGQMLPGFHQTFDDAFIEFSFEDRENSTRESSSA